MHPSRIILSLVALTLGALLPSCVTSGDLHEVAFQVERIESALADETKNAEEVKAEVNSAHAAIEAVAADVEERTKGWVDGLSQGTEGGIIGIASALALNYYRNQTRKKKVVLKDDVNGAGTAKV